MSLYYLRKSQVRFLGFLPIRQETTASQLWRLFLDVELIDIGARCHRYLVRVSTTHCGAVPVVQSKCVVRRLKVCREAERADIGRVTVDFQTSCDILSRQSKKKTSLASP